jgi:S-adenosylmethionine decarboxylase
MRGREWIVEAHGCDPDALRDPERLRGLFDAILATLKLSAVHRAQWHTFPGAGGVTGLQLLAESHLACHTFPEFGSLCLNVFCCRPRPDWDARELLHAHVGAQSISVRVLEREYAGAGTQMAGPTVRRATLSS